MLWAAPRRVRPPRHRRLRPDDGSIVVNGKRRTQRTVYLTEDGCRYVEAWICHRGDGPGPLFCPISQTGEVRISRMRGESIAFILRRRQEEADTAPLSPHDLLRSFVTTLLDSGEDVLTVQKLAGHADVATTAPTTGGVRAPSGGRCSAS